MSDLIQFNGAIIPEAADLKKALSESAKVISTNGPQLLKMDRQNGSWSYGAEHHPVNADDLWAVNPYSFVHGYIAWSDSGTVVGEEMVSNLSSPSLPPVPSRPTPGASKGWQVQVGFSLKGISDNVKDVEARYFAVSAGGRKEVSKLLGAIVNRISVNPTLIVPVISLSHSFYMHQVKSHGKVFTPVFDVKDFIGVNGEKSAASLEDNSGNETARRRRAE